MKTNEFIRELLAAAQESGIPDAEAYYHQSETKLALVNQGKIEEYTVSTNGGISLRGLIDGKLGMSYTEALDREAIVMLIRGVLDSATLTSDQDEQFIFAGSDAYPTVDASGDLGDDAQCMDLALALDEAGRSSDPRVRDLSFTFVQTSHDVVRILNSRGLNLAHTSDTVAAYISAIARADKRVTTGEAVRVTRSLAALDPRALAEEAIADATSQLAAAPCESGEMPVILRNGAMTSLLETFCGIFSADAAQKGLSLLAGKEGEGIAAPCVTLVDDPLRADGLYSRAFDAEGVATQRKAIVEKGVLKTLLHNLKTAKKAGVATTANAARSSYDGPIGIAPSNLYIQPGEMDLAALQAAMGDGLVITRLEGLHAGANAVSGDFSLLCRGFLVRGGRPAQAVEQVTVAGNLYQLLRGIVAVGSDLKPQSEHVFCPSVWVDSLSIAGK